MAPAAVDGVDASPRPHDDGTTLPYFHRSIIFTAISYPTFSTPINMSSRHPVLCTVWIILWLIILISM